MKTIIFKFKTTPEIQQAIAEDSRVCSSMKRIAFNRFQEGKSQTEVYRILTKLFPTVNSHLRNSSLRNALSLYSSWKLKNNNLKVYFGQFKRFQKGLISKEEYQNSKIFGIISEGEAQYGNRFFKIDIEHNQIIWKRNRKEHYNLELIETLNKNRKLILSTLQSLMLEKKIPLTVKVKNNNIYLTYDEILVEGIKKKFKNLFNNRVLGIDLNPNYFGISVIEFDKKDNYKVIHKECIDLTKLQEQSTNKIKFELYEINHHILKLCKQFHCGKLSVEDLKFDNKKNFWNKDLNRLCKNKFRFSLIKSHLQTLCNIFGVELIEVNAAYSSIIGNFRHGSENCSDPIASSIEIARRSYHKFQKGWFQPRFVSKQRLQQVLGNQWKKELELGYNCWKGLGEKIKKLKLKYRFQLNSLNAVFSKDYIKRHWILYVF